MKHETKQKSARTILYPMIRIVCPCSTSLSYQVPGTAVSIMPGRQVYIRALQNLFCVPGDRDFTSMQHPCVAGFVEVCHSSDTKYGLSVTVSPNCSPSPRKIPDPEKKDSRKIPEASLEPIASSCFEMLLFFFTARKTSETRDGFLPHFCRIPQVLAHASSFPPLLRPRIISP